VRILPEGIQESLGVFLGRLVFVLLKGRRTIALNNIQRVFPGITQRERETIARRCFEKLGINFIESLVLPYVPQEDYHVRFTIEHRSYVDDALTMNRGVIALGFHYGNWEIMGITSYLLHHDIIALARPLKRYTHLNSYLNHLRRSTGLLIIPNEDTGRDVVRYLKENKIVAILGDQREKRSRAVFVEFFNEKVATSKGIAVIGMKTGAPVIPMYMVRAGFLRYRIVVTQPLVMEREGNISELIYTNTRKINAFLESLIKKNPDEWFWVHRRWGRDS
jgi:KDO2-lipid IV(A) lauroyltransferase